MRNGGVGVSVGLGGRVDWIPSKWSGYGVLGVRVGVGENASARHTHARTTMSIHEIWFWPALALALALALRIPDDPERFHSLTDDKGGRRTAATTMKSSLLPLIPLHLLTGSEFRNPATTDSSDQTDERDDR